MDAEEAAAPYVPEQNARWTACDEFINAHLVPSSHPYHKALEHAHTNAMAKGLEDIAVAPLQGKFLSVQCQILGAKYILEVGTMAAYSTIWMASSSPDVKIVTLEIDPKTAEIAREHIRYAGLEDRVELIVGAAADVLPQLVDEVEQANGRNSTFLSSMPTRTMP